MGRKGWIVAGVAAVLIGGSVIALLALTGQMGYRTMKGPVAIIQGPLPENGFLGIEFASKDGRPPTVTGVLAGSGAAEAGLQAGDVIVAVGDVKAPDEVALKRVTEKSKPGDTLALRIRRGDEERDVSVRLISIEALLELDLARHPPRAARSTTATTAPAIAD